jgi:hypothetical protein
MRRLPLFVCAVVACISSTTSAHVVAGDAAVQAQWFTGSLEAPSPALPKAGIFATEPYFIYSSNTGSYDNSGAHHSTGNDGNQFQTIVLLKYALTDRISVQAIPSVVQSWNKQSNGTGIGDLPVEVDYRFNDENNMTGFPSVTASLGINLPTGHYERLHPSLNGLDGLGSGSYTLKEGLLAQSLFDTSGHHPVRLRFYAEAFEPVATVPVQGISVYGTDQGFGGHATPGFASVLGIGGGIALDQQWVLALDLVQHFSGGSHLLGNEVAGPLVNTKAPGSARTAVAPAVEYNLSDSLGIIAGVEFSVAGRNSGSYVAPQIAVSMAF